MSQGVADKFAEAEEYVDKFSVGVLVTEESKISASKQTSKVIKDKIQY